MSLAWLGVSCPQRQQIHKRMKPQNPSTHTHTRGGSWEVSCQGGAGAGRQLATAAAQTRLIKECKFRKITRHCLTLWILLSLSVSPELVPSPAQCLCECGKRVLRFFPLTTSSMGRGSGKVGRCPAPAPSDPDVVFVLLR